MRSTVKLGEICDILDKKRKPITQKDRTKGIYPYYGASGILDYVADYIFDEDLVLIGEDGAKWGALDNSAFKVSGKVWVNNHAHVIRPYREKILDDFLVYFLVSSDLSDYITGTTVPKLNQERLKLIEIPFPTLETQKAIVAKLDQIFAELDQTKSEIQKNLDNTDELWRSALNQAFQGDWEMKKLGDCVKIIGGGTPSKNNKSYYENGQISWATVRDMNEDIIKETELKITELGLKNSSSNVVPKEGIVIATRVGLGKVCYLDKDTAINQDLKGIIPQKNIIKEYLFYFFKNIAEFIVSKGTGATVKGVSLDFVKNIELPVPPLSEQEKIVEYLDQVSKEVKDLKSQYQSQLDNLEELKKSVLDEAFRGEIGE